MNHFLKYKKLSDLKNQNNFLYKNIHYGFLEACRMQRLKIINTLLEFQIDVNYIDQNGCSGLYLVSYRYLDFYIA